MARWAFFSLLVIGMTLPCMGQGRPIDNYIAASDDYNEVAAAAPGQRTAAKLRNILPASLSQRWAEYVITKTGPLPLVQDVEKLRLNKQVGTPAGPTGVTSIVSRVAVPALLGFGVEYGNILQNSSGNTTTLRANLLGVARMALGYQQFPYCPVIDQARCQPVSRWFRRFSGETAFENRSVNTSSGTATVGTSTTPIGVNLTGNGFRMASWGARFDITQNNPTDPGFAGKFQGAIDKLKTDDTSKALTAAVSDLFQNSSDVYSKWQVETLAILQNAPAADFKNKLDQQLNILMQRMMAAHPDFLTRIAAVEKAAQNYFDVRDNLLQQIQSHRASIEYTNQHPLNQPSTSNVRAIYSHQPSQSPTLITINAAVTWYNSLPAAPATSRLRDVQAAGQLDQRLGQIPNLGNAVVTFGGYYQWMKEDALITIGPGNVAPGSGIVLPGTAAKLLGTKGNIGIIQGKLTIPMTTTIKMPLSLTWSNRTELINESDTRGQIGVTFDLDSLFK